MRKNLTPALSVLLAAALQLMPLLRNIVGFESQGLAPSGYAFILKIGVGAVALLGFDAVSSATSVTISPVTATFGQPYRGTITYESTYAGQFTAMTITNVCMSSPVQIAPGLTAIYNSFNTATVTGTPTMPGTYSVSVEPWTSGCNGGLTTGPHAFTLIVLGTPPVWVTSLSNTVAQVGSSLVWGAAASANPAAGYYWQWGTNPVPVATQASLTNNNVQLADAGQYTLTATNSAGSISNSAYLSVVVAPANSWLYSGSPLTVTNYQPAGSTLTLSAFITNLPAASNQYQWSFNGFPIPNATSPSLVVSNVPTSKSGIYAIFFTSTLTTTNGAVITTNVLANEDALSKWQFGHAPAILTQPTNQTPAAGGSAMFAVTASGDSLMGTNYQWYFNAAPLAGQTNASLAISSVNAGNLGNYFVAVTNVYGAVTSSVASLIGTNFPTQPVLTASLAGANLQLTWATSSGTFQIQTAISPSGPWSTTSLPLTTNGTSATVTVTATNQQQYYRLSGN
jgi:hypothetical protein